MHIPPIEVHAVGDEVTMAVGYVDVGDRGEDSGRSPSQRDALDCGGRSAVVREEVSPEHAVDLCEDDVAKAGAGLGIEQDFLTGEGALGGSPDARRGGVVVCEVEVAGRQDQAVRVAIGNQFTRRRVYRRERSSVRFIAFLARCSREDCNVVRMAVHPPKLGKIARGIGRDV